MNKGKLYIVSTPIGNLEDITLRALRILKEVTMIAAEDTRRTKKLLNFYQIATPLTSLYDQNELQKSSFLISKLNEGHDIAYVSDAGTPGISDPGYILITQSIEHEITVVSVPGPTAAITALSISGLPMDSFSFYAFLPVKKGKRRDFLTSLTEETKTMIFYESPKRLIEALQDIYEILGNRKIVIARELTKLFEEVFRGQVTDTITFLKTKEIKGEITIIIAGAEKTSPPDFLQQIRARYNALTEKTNLSTRDIVSLIADETNASRKVVYKEIVRLMKSRA